MWIQSNKVIGFKFLDFKVTWRLGVFRDFKEMDFAVQSGFLGKKSIFRKNDDENDEF